MTAEQQAELRAAAESALIDVNYALRQLRECPFDGMRIAAFFRIQRALDGLERVQLGLSQALASIPKAS